MQDILSALVGKCDHICHRGRDLNPWVQRCPVCQCPNPKFDPKAEAPTVFVKGDVPDGYVDITADECLALAALPRVVRPERFQKLRRMTKCPRPNCGKLVGNHSAKKFREHFVISTFGEPLERRAAAVTAEREAEEENRIEAERLKAMNFPEVIAGIDVAKVSGKELLFGCRVKYINEPGAPRSIELIGLAGDLVVVTARYEQHGKHEAHGGDWYLTRLNDSPRKNAALVAYREERARQITERRLYSVDLEEVTGAALPG